MSAILADLLSQVPDVVYPSLCTMQAYTETPDSYGQIGTTYANISGMTNLPCRLAPLVLRTPTNTETRKPDLTQEMNQVQIALRGYYPSIVPKMQAVVDGTAYNVLGVDFDGNHTQTRIRAEIVKS